MKYRMYIDEVGNSDLGASDSPNHNQAESNISPVVNYLHQELIFVGVAFVSGPAKLLFTMSGFSLTFWLALIFLYYILATLLPIDKIIGPLYPFFGGALIFMAIGIFLSMIVKWAGGSLT